MFVSLNRRNKLTEKEGAGEVYHMSFMSSAPSDFQPHQGLLRIWKHPTSVLTMWLWNGNHPPQTAEPRSPATVWRSARRPAKSGSRWRTSSRTTLPTRSPVWRMGWDTTSPSPPRTRLAMENPVRLKLLSNPRSQKVGITVFLVGERKVFYIINALNCDS